MPFRMHIIRFGKKGKRNQLAEYLNTRFAVPCVGWPLRSVSHRRHFSFDT